MANYAYDGVRLTWPKDARLAARLTIIDLESGNVLYEGESREVKAGESVTIEWTRPSE